MDVVPTATGARLVGRYLYVRGLASLTILDVADPLHPRTMSRLAMPADANGVEDPDTDGNILLWARPTGAGADGAGELYVVDVRDKTAPTIVGYLSGEVAHTYECVLDCRWAYEGQTGGIIDLRDPTEPQRLKRPWSAGLFFVNPPPMYESYDAHDVTEVAPGLILTASTPMYLLDARADPRRPKVLAVSDGSPHSFGGVAWPNGARDRFVISWSEAFQAPRCEIRDAGKDTSLDSAFKTWDARDWRSGAFTGLDRYYIQNGTYLDGEPAFSGGPPGVAGCSASWFDVHPTFENGGLIAAAATQHGVKFLRISDRGRFLRDPEYFLPHGGNVVAAYWVSKRIVYTTDAYRGIDILRYTGPLT